MPLLLLMAACTGLFDNGVIDKTCEDLPAGCDGTAGDEGIDTAPPEVISIEAVDPAYGLTAGGDDIVITGGPFDASVAVKLGARDATLVSWQPGSVRVTTPAASAVGWTSISITTDAGEGSLDEGFAYFPDGTGETGMLGELQFRESVGSLAGLGTSGRARLVFIEPDTGAAWWQTWTNSLGRCQTDYQPDLGWENRDPGASTLTLTEDGGGTLALKWDSALQAYNGQDGSGVVDADDMPAGSAFSIASFEGAEFPEFGADDVVELPTTFDLLAPAEMLSTAGGTLGRGDLSFRWSGSGTGDGVLIGLRLVDPDTGAELQEVTCAAEDEGSFTVPSSAFTEWDAGLTLYITVGRAIETTSTLPLDRSDMRVLGSYVLVGAVTTE
ncbi:MAG: IPT/TIG domain-containing protein [Alphaproteobacteria bacterium]|nr:IPT/TIG domain-containing protein [Alphaproteobacteria bacterium]